MGLQVHLVDGTYELFRYFYALPDHINDEGMDVAATRGVVGTCLSHSGFAQIAFRVCSPLIEASIPCRR